MKYMLLIYGSTDAWDEMTKGNWDDLSTTHSAVIEELRASGEFIQTSELATEGARVVRTKDGTPIVTDGPFAEVKEIVGGYYLVDCASLDRATEIAAKFAEAEFAPIEVRRLGG